MRFLIAESEPPAAREKRRDSVGRSSGETFLARLAHLVPEAHCERVKPADRGRGIPEREDLSSYDAVFLTGSPLHLYEDTLETRREIEFMRAVFQSRTPSFGSCAGLQVAVVAAGGTVRSMRSRREAGFARRIVRQAMGERHPLLEGRPAVFDAPAVHTDEVEELPPWGSLLASNAVTRVQAAEIRHEGGTFWGVQYHPEISLREVAAALNRGAGDLIEHGLARNQSDVETHAAMIEALHYEPDRRDLAWRLGLDEQITDAAKRMPDNLYATSAVRDPRQQVTNNNYQMTIEWDPSDTLSLSSITNRNIDDVLQTGGLPPAATPFAVRPLTPGGVFTDPQIGPSDRLTVLSYNTFLQKQWSQELRLQSSFGGAVDFNLGAFYYQTIRDSDVYFFANGQTIYAQTAVPSAYVDPNNPPDGTGHTYYHTRTNYRLDSKAAFGELYIRPTDTIRLTLGARYTSDLKRQPLTPLQLFTPGRGLVTTGYQRRVFNEWTGRANIDWNITPENMVYAGYSRGYKGGGFNPPVTGDPNSAFDPETVNAFEIGSKNTFFDRRLTLNLTGFHYKYKV